jgi:membrane protease YdiL (CAAX protease family)
VLQLALFITSMTWFFFSQALAGHAAQGLSVRFALPDVLHSLLNVILLLFLLTVGFCLLQAIAHRQTSVSEALGLPRRATASREWALGAAIGWGSVVLIVLPMALAGTLQITFWTSPRSFWLLIVNLAVIAVSSLAEEVAFRGYPFRRLIQAMGPVAATICMSLFFGLLHALNPSATGTSIFVTMLAGLLLSIAWLRTHGLWLPWGLHFAWNASMGVLFGLPVSGITDFNSIIQTQATGRLWLTGGDYGPEGAIFTAVVLLIAIAVLITVTRDYAWDYTHRTIVAAGYPMDVPPPAAHTAMEEQIKPAGASLVQILPTTPQTRSVGEEPKS